MKDECITAVSNALGRTISQKEAQDIDSRISNALKLMAQQDRQGFIGKDQAARLREAAQLAGDQLEAEAAKKKQRVARTIQAHDRVENYLTRMKEKFPEMTGLDALRRKLAFHSDMKNTETSIEYEAKAIEYNALRQMTSALEAINPKIFGLFANKEGTKAFIHELFGQDASVFSTPEVSKMAKAAAQEWLKVAEDLRVQFNAEGGEIGQLEDWRMPQHYADSLVLKSTEGEFVNDFLPAIDREKYIHEDGRLYSEAEIIEFLKESRITIATGGANKGEAARLPGMKARRHAEHRSIHFKDAENYMKIMEKYGGNDTYSSLIGHVSRMSRDLALVREFGPNPDALFDLFKTKIVTEGAKADPEQARKLARQAVSTESLYNFISGRTLPVANEWLSNGFDTLRNWLAATRLGSAFISSIPDMSTMHLTAAANNMSSMRLFQNQLKTLKPRNAEERRILQRAGLGMETFIGSVNRWGADSMGPSFSAKAAGLTMRASALNAITEARRRAFGVTMYGSIGSTVKKFKNLSSLPETDRRILESKGVTEEIFQVWKKADLEDWRGNDMLTPDAIYRIPDLSPEKKQDAALKLLAHVLEEIDMAVVVPQAKDRAMMTAGLQKGTWKGEITRSFWLFKGFPVSVIARHYGRAMSFQSPVGKAAYIGAFVAGSTILGAFSQQIYEIMNGRDPKDMTKGKFWTQAVLKGGSLGVYGDFVFQTNTTYGNTPLAVLSGPVAGYVEDVVGLTQGNIIQAFQGKETNIGPEALRLIKSNIPLQNLWYTRAVTDRLIFQNLQEMIDPGYTRKIERKMKKEYGQEFWWNMGPGSPERGPDLGRVTGD